jgi:hypothetical protein
MTTKYIKTEQELFEYYTTMSDSELYLPVLFEEKYQQRVPGTAYNGNELMNLYSKNNQEFLSFANQCPGWYNKCSNMLYVPQWSTFDTEFMLSVDEITNLYDERNDWVLTTDYPKNAFKWTISSHPQIRFAINYRYCKNDFYYNITGHPSGFYQVGSKVIREQLNRTKWPFMSQVNIINYHNVDLVIPDHILLSNGFIERCPDLFFNKDLITVIQKYWSTNKIEYQQKWAHNILYGIPYNPHTLRQIYLEECVHEFFRSDEDLKINLERRYSDDFNNLVLDPLAASMRLDYYYNYVETGEYINEY